jgi:hypothetical protein
MYKSIKLFLCAIALVAFTTTSAFAVTIGNNVEARWDLGFYLFATGQQGQYQNETYRFVFNPQEGIVNFGQESNGLFNFVNFTAAIMDTVEIQRYDHASQQYLNVAGNLNGSLQLGFSNVSFDQATNQVAALHGVSNGAGLLLNINGIVEGNTFQFTTGLNPAYMDIMTGKFNGIWDSIVTAFGQNGAANFAMSIKTDGFIDAWVMNNFSQIQINGQSHLFSLHGDIHSSISEIPEPATMGLLFSGLLGGVAARRRQKALQA